MLGKFLNCLNNGKKSLELSSSFSPRICRKIQLFLLNFINFGKSRLGALYLNFTRNYKGDCLAVWMFECWYNCWEVMFSRRMSALGEHFNYFGFMWFSWELWNNQVDTNLMRAVCWFRNNLIDIFVIFVSPGHYWALLPTTSNYFQFSSGIFQVHFPEQKLTNCNLMPETKQKPKRAFPLSCSNLRHYS